MSFDAAELYLSWVRQSCLLVKTADRKSQSRTMLTSLIAFLLTLIGTGSSAEAGLIFLEDRTGAASVQVRFLPDETEAIDDLPAGEWERLLVTGAYSSGDRFAPEGFVIRHGDPTHPWPQGWDGLLVTAPDGTAAIHDVTRIDMGDAWFNLRDKTERRAFVDRAGRDGLTAIQSHLLINEGVLDVHPRDGAPRFRRRLLFQLDDGRLGLWDTHPRAATLHEAAVELFDALAPRMALNLDMGAYDFCEKATSNAAESCGIVDRRQMQNLTNLIEITAPALLP